VLRLEAQVPLHVHHYRGRGLARDLPQHLDVLRDQRELLGRLCVWSCVME